MTGSEPPPYAAEGEGEGEKKPDPARRRKVRLWVAMAAGVLGILCLGGVGVAVLLYDEETKIERTAPDAVADNFLRAYLLNRDDKEASLYTCGAAADLAEISTLRSEIISREQNFDVKVSVSWSTLTVVDVDPSRKTVDADLVIAGSSNGNAVSRRTESWSLGLVDKDGWRVCSAVKTS
ncbi:MAG: hypothetical protein ABW022_17065 [Actinoplanes sp.]